MRYIIALEAVQCLIISDTKEGQQWKTDGVSKTVLFEVSKELFRRLCEKKIIPSWYAKLADHVYTWIKKEKKFNIKKINHEQTKQTLICCRVNYSILVLIY